MRLFWRWTAALAVALGAFVYFNNRSGAPAEPGKPLLLAHRGLAQTYPRDGLTNDTCTAARIHPPTHSFLENTIASMQAAFAEGADIVELDIHPTTDGHFAVFHDWTLDCRTDGRGVTRKHTLATLKALDVGFGYTADGGATFPFRGKGVGLMPSLAEVFAAFPDRRLLINVKSNDPAEGTMLAEHLRRLPPERIRNLMAYGGDRPIDALRAPVPELPVMSKTSLKACLLRYLATGWSGHVPEACRNTLLLVPINYAPLAWGWPHLFVERMRAHGTLVFVTGEYDGDAGASGIDDAAQATRLPAGYRGGIWTNRIDLIAPAVAAAR